MSTIATELTTAEEFFQWVHRPENRDKSFDLERGEIVDMPPPTKYHSFVCQNVGAVLWNFAKGRDRGYVCSNDAVVIVEEDPDTVRGPDISFYDDDQTAADMDRGYAVVPPLLTVDVLSPGDRLSRLVRRVTQLLKRGVQLVWVIDPEAREVCVYRPGHDPYVVTENEELTGDDVLPDFRCRVSEFFALPGEGSNTSDKDNSKD